MAQARFGVKEVCDCYFINLETGKPELFLDTLKVSNLEGDAQEAVARGGKGNPELLSWDYNKTATFHIQNALLDLRAFARQHGTDVNTGAVEIYKREVLTAVASQTTGKTEVTLSQTPIAGSVTVFLEDEGEGGTEVANTINGNKLQFADTDVAANEKVIVYYRFTSDASAKTITVDSAKFGGYYKVIGDTVVRNEVTGLDEPAQLVIPKAKISSKFTLTMQAEGDPSAFDMDLKVFKDPATGKLFDLIKY